MLRGVILTEFVLHRLGKLVDVEGENLVELGHSSIAFHWRYLNELILIVHIDVLLLHSILRVNLNYQGAYRVLSSGRVVFLLFLLNDLDLVETGHKFVLPQIYLGSPFNSDLHLLNHGLLQYLLFICGVLLIKVQTYIICAQRRADVVLHKEKHSHL